MTRDRLAAALALNGSGSARAARALLLDGADFTWLSEGHKTISAHRFWDTWSWRLEVMRDTGVTPRSGLAEAVDQLRGAGDNQTHLATIVGTGGRFTVFLSADLATCIACM
jgi:hypothetical protein